MDKLLYGAAYYDEYMPCERLAEDVKMWKKAGMNVVRIAESTWSTCEPQEGVFDFSHVTRVLDACEEAGVSVIIGTPTYAVPTWLVKKYPDVLAVTKQGQAMYGHRQNMDITNPDYLRYSERVIRKLMEVSAHRSCVIGFQLDNETKYYGTAGKNVQEAFVQYLREKFNDDLDAMNERFGLDYWSNRINAWEDFPDVRGTINGSLGAEFEKFQRSLVTNFLAWQADIVSEYKREDQFITHNLDFAWKGYSYGVQPDVDQKEVAKHLTIAGCDIYHKTQDELTGREIAFGGDLIRSLKQDNYLILETEAQGFPGWTPYPGQLRLQAFSHLASGANGVEYWHWHSIHNSFETYWKGVLSHDFAENAVYREACIVGHEFERLSPQLINLKKHNQAAILVSNEALTALNWFGIEATAADNGETVYNDVVRRIYDVLYDHNIECDFLFPDVTAKELAEYRLVVTPALYAASEELLGKLRDFVNAGGVLVSTYKTAFADECVKVYHDVQPHALTDVFGMHYHEFTFPKQVGLRGEILEDHAEISGALREVSGETAASNVQKDACDDCMGDKRDSLPQAEIFMELLEADTAEVLLDYAHAYWKDYAAVTRNSFGDGKAYYIGCGCDADTRWLILQEALRDAKIKIPTMQYPLIQRTGTNGAGKQITYYLNYSGEACSFVYDGADGTELISGEKLTGGQTLTIEAWGLRIAETDV